VVSPNTVRFLTIEGTNIPQLKRVVVFSGNRVVVAPTLDKAIEAVLGAPQPEVVKATTTPELNPLTRARLDLEKAEEAMRGTLENSLRVVIVRNDLAPVVTTMANYLAGSNEAPVGFPGTVQAAFAKWIRPEDLIRVSLGPKPD